METYCKVCGGAHITGACIEKQKGTEQGIKIDTAPMWEAQYDKFKGYLDSSLNQISSADISQAQKEIRQSLTDEKDEKRFMILSAHEQIIAKLGSLKAIKDKRSIIEQMTKDDYLSDPRMFEEDNSVGCSNEHINNAAWQLANMCKAAKEMTLSKGE